ncbi:MAG: YegS/Rv2252/BmrU family lipid kinase [Clostridia bacterium]|nr:YegS/Rv2252/BmrU family lipid kinase [Clostridia bacterium]
MHTKRILLIYNPRSGSSFKRPSAEKIAACFDPQRFTVEIAQTAYRGHATQIARTRAAEFDLVVCCGGDGTLNEVIAGLMHAQSRPALGYFPIGTTNDMAKAIGIPADLQQAAALIMDGHTRALDLGQWNNRYFAYVACFGLGVHVSYRTPQLMKNLLGYSAYMINGFGLQTIPTLRQVKPRHIRIEFDDGEVLEDDFYFGTVSNATAVGGVFHFNPDDVRLNDGKYELLLVRRLKKPTDIFRMLRRIKARDYDGDSLIFQKTTGARFVFDKPDAWSLDGEFGGTPETVDFRLLPQAIEIFAPENPLFLPDAHEPQNTTVNL